MQAPTPQTPDSNERPEWACLLHRAPSNGVSWKVADQGYRTCEGCLIRLRDVIADIRDMYHRLDATPGAWTEGGDSRGPQGFESRPAASPHIVTMKDGRSKTYEVAVDGWSYEGWAYDPDGWVIMPLPEGMEGPWAIGSYTSKREFWIAADGRGHSEQARPPRSIPKALASLAQMIAEDRDMEPPAGTIDHLCHWLDVHMDHVTRCDWVGDVNDELRTLKAQLAPVTGEGRKHKIMACPNVIDEGEHSRVCSHNLYEPDKHGIIRCHGCKREWPRDKWHGPGPEYLSQIAVDERVKRVA